VRPRAGRCYRAAVPIDPDVQDALRRVLASLEMLLPKPVATIDWRACHAANWRRRAFTGYLEPVASVEAIHLSDLLGIEEQKRVVELNTRQFLAGVPANNVLLWGTRGTGKSSLVRALLHAHAHEGLRIIQVEKDDLVSLPAIVDQIRGEPFRFILFSDDVSFEVGESSYKMLKSALDGSVYATPENVLIYVTSNRRHMLPEFETDNLGAMLVHNEIHHGEAVEEKISLSGRFGIWVAFHAFSQDQYVAVVKQWVAKLCERSGARLEWTPQAEDAAVAWSHQKGDRSGRIAYQFASHWVGTSLLRSRT
jgi:predicted AAA+ superfamily ATPase